MSAALTIPLADAEQTGTGWLSDALREDTRTPVPRRVAFKMDFVAWRGALTKKRRRMLDALASGSGTCEVARKFGVCPRRVSQVRSELASSWRAFRSE